jgi:hypothetical protein
MIPIQQDQQRQRALSYFSINFSLSVDFNAIFSITSLLSIHHRHRHNSN